MRRSILLPLLALAGGAAGAALRMQQWLVSYNAETMTFDHSGTYLLPVLLVALACLLALLLHGGRTPSNVERAYRCPTVGYMLLKTLASFLLLGAGALALLNGIQAIQMARMNMAMGSGMRMDAYPLILTVCGVFCVLSCPCLLALARGFYHDRPSRIGGVLSLIPSCAALTWAFATHTDHSSDPILNSYGYVLLTAVLMTLAHYYVAGYFQDRRFPRRAALCCLLGLSSGVIACLDLVLDLEGFSVAQLQAGLFPIVMTVALCLSALADAYALLRAVFGPPWPRRLLAQRSGRSADSGMDSGSLSNPDFTAS